jgi:predicted transposase YbfD/YdcC
MPAARSSPIPAAATVPDHARPLAVGECPGLLERLAMLPDPRDRRGRRHPLASVLAVSAAAVLAGARSVTPIAEWAADAPWPVLVALGVRRDPLTRRCHVPGEATIRRVLARVDGDAVDASIGAWLADRLRPPRHRRVLAVDGKRLRGSARSGHQVHLLAALDHHDGAVLAQREVPAATNEIAEFQPLLAGLDLAGALITADALHTQRDHAAFLVDRGADYLLVVKANQPALHAQLASLPWRQIPVMDRTRDHGHGRIEVRTLKVAAVAGLCFPHAAQAIQVTRRVRAPGSRCWRTVTVYAVTSLPLGTAQPHPAGRLAARALEDREPAALGPRRDLRRRRLHRAHRQPSPRDGQPAQPRRRRVAPGRPPQPRRSAATHRPRPCPTARPPRPGIPMTPTSQHLDGALGENPPRLSLRSRA